MAGRSANTNRNGGSAFCPRLANLLQRNLCARISSAGNCDRFLHTYRIPQAVPRILGIPDGSRASRRKKKRKRGGGRRLGAGKREAETTKTKGAADKKFPHRYSAHSESLRECEQCRYIEYLFSFRSDASHRIVANSDSGG